jgi:hypothetical protein
LPPSDEFLVVPLFRFPDRSHLKHLEYEDRFDMLIDDRLFRFNEDLATVFEFILERGNTPVKAVFDARPHGVSKERVREFLASLVKFGAVCLKDPLTSGTVESSGSSGQEGIRCVSVSIEANGSG